MNLFDPGAVATKLRGMAMPGEDPASIAQPADVAPLIAALCLPAEARNGVVVRHAGRAGMRDGPADT